MEKRKNKTKPLIDFNDKKLTIVDLMQKLKEINNEIKDISFEVEVYIKMINLFIFLKIITKSFKVI